MKVLLVDDDPDMALLVEAVLDDPTDSVTVVTTGSQALPMARAIAPDMVMLDVMLPDISGMEVLQRMRAAPDTAALPVVVCSASASPAERAEMLALGANGTIAKPFDPLALRNDLLQYLSDAR